MSDEIKNFKKTLEGFYFKQVYRKGKYIIAELVRHQTGSNGSKIGMQEYLYLVIHLTMTGGFLINKLHPKERIVFELNTDTLYFKDDRKYANVYLLNADDTVEFFKTKHLGVDALNSNVFELERPLIMNLYTPTWRDKPIYDALMNQTLIAGLGNIYVNEVLFEAKINPTVLCGTLTWDQVKIISESIALVTAHAYGVGGSSISTFTDVDGEKGEFQLSHRVYGKHNERCQECGGRIRKATMIGRSAFYCIRCQPLPEVYDEEDLNGV